MGGVEEVGLEGYKTAMENVERLEWLRKNQDFTI